MLKKSVLILLIICFAATLTACYDAVELSDYSYVYMVGVDKGVSDKWRLTFYIRTSPEDNGNDQSSGMSEKTGSSITKSITVDAPSFYGGVELVNTTVSRALNFTHALFVVFAEDIAREEGLKAIIAPLMRYWEIRNNVDLLVSKGTAMEFLESYKPFTGSSVSRAVDDLKGQSENTSLFTVTSLHDFYDCIESTYHQPIMIYGAAIKKETLKYNKENHDRFNILGDVYAGDLPKKLANDNVEILGMAVFNGDRMVGRLTGHEARMLSIGKGIFSSGIFTMQDPQKPEYIIPIQTRQQRKPKTKINFVNNKPVIDLDVYLEGDILAIQSRINYERPEKIPVVEKAAEKFIKEGLDRTIAKTQALNCDAFKFGQKAVTQFGTIQEWEGYNWNNHYKEASINTNVHFTVRRTGTILDSAPIIYSEDEDK